VPDDNTPTVVVAAVDHIAHSAAVTETLYRRHAQRVLRYCLGSLRRPADAEDALQQTFLQAHRALARGEEPVSEVAWLLAIARNVCITRADAHRRRIRRETTEDPIVLDEVASTLDADEGLSAEVQAAFGRLSDRQRQALFLREWHGSSYAEIAVALETTESAVETLIFRARRALADELGSRTRRRPPVAAALPWLRGWLESTAAKVAVGAATASVAAGTAVTLEAHRPPPGAAPATTTTAASAPRAAVASSPARRVVRRRQATTAPPRRRAPTAGDLRAAPAAPSADRPPAVPVATPPAPARADSARSVEPASPARVGQAPTAQRPATTTTEPVEAAPTTTVREVVDAPAGAAPAVGGAAQAVGETVTSAAQATNALAQTVDGAAQAASATVGGVAQTVGDAIPAAAPAADAVSQVVGGAAQTTSTTVDQTAAVAQAATSTAGSALATLLGGR
jgi:RNA polymerase sigma-70 factor (ECF subfamily)